MRIRTLFLYLIGNRRAIREIAGDSRAFWVGLLFVLSAGFAREYDGEDLLHEPWHLVIPLVASVGASFVLFLILYVMRPPEGTSRPAFGPTYRSFLTLFWMTAPLAWLYAIPFERMLSPGDATRANLWCLGLVATWRVLLMIRVASVLTGCRSRGTFFLIMLFADAVALAALLFAPLPIISIMGGIRYSESELLIHNAACLIETLGVITLPIWFIGSIVVIIYADPTWPATSEFPRLGLRVSRSLWALVAASVLVWGFAMPFTQPEQQLRHRVERDLRAGRIREALSEMSAHRPEDFPPLWDPPPHLSYGRHDPPIEDVLEAIARDSSAAWVREVYLLKLERTLNEVLRGPTVNQERLAASLHRIPGAVELLCAQKMWPPPAKSFVERLQFEQAQPRKYTSPEVPPAANP